ncbi:MAG: helix-turn-helix domain-containing protein [Bacteroidales bacterium]|nr:helix-turn-helix domain-containing protein [Bacteroidales bacterium]
MTRIEAYKGIPPGAIITHSLKRKNLSQRDLANRLNIHFQTVSAIVTGKRDIPEHLTFKLDKALGFEEGFFLLIQAYHKIRKHYGINSETASLPRPSIRPVVFWDIDIERLDWITNKDFIIERVMQRGNKEEKESIRQYYGL